MNLDETKQGADPAAWVDACTADVVAVRVVAASPATVFDFLADLRNHWRLEDRFVELSSLHGQNAEPRLGGRVRLKGPLGIAREVDTRVLAAEPATADRPARLAGRGEIGSATTGRVSWGIAAHESGGALVTLAAVVDRASALDRALLVAGRWWLQRTFTRALANLDAVLRPVATPGERSASQHALTKRRVSTALARYLVNPLVRTALNLGIAPRGWALLETTGRKSGQPRRTPVGNGLDGDTFWIVAEHGGNAAYVRNIEADPAVRVRVGTTWRAGTAHLMPADDPRERQRTIGRPFNAAVVRLMGTDLLTIRIDLQ